MSALTPNLPLSRDLGQPTDSVVHIGTDRANVWSTWWPLGVGIAALLGSTAFRFSQSLWQQPEYEHQPLLLAAALWLFWREREAFRRAAPSSSIRIATSFIILGLLVYLFGVRVKAAYIEFGALLPVITGALLLFGGVPLVRKVWFALLFLALATPLPAFVIVAATSGLKEWVSQAAEAILHVAGYPIARDGVTLRVGPYHLLLADACSGMNSLISLAAVGLLYLHLTARRNVWHTLVLLASIVPIAVTTNIVRVLILTLITYHLGDEAGQGFLHEFAGFVMFLIAVFALAFVDAILRKIFLVPQGNQNVGH